MTQGPVAFSTREEDEDLRINLLVIINRNSRRVQWAGLGSLIGMFCFALSILIWPSLYDSSGVVKCALILFVVGALGCLLGFLAGGLDGGCANKIHEGLIDDLIHKDGEAAKWFSLLSRQGVDPAYRRMAARLMDKAKTRWHLG